MVKVFICGGSGYTGCELLRILISHPNVVITGVTSERSSGKKVSDLFPNLHHYERLRYEQLNVSKIVDKAEVFFMALPHAESQEAVDFLYRHGKIVIDLSADYRLKDATIYEKWYKVTHRFRQTLKRAVYGLPEIYRNKIKRAKLIANPGCYPTGAILGLMPAIKHNLIDIQSIIIDAKSGVSGAGRKADISVSFCEVNEGFKAYAVGTHRHTPEIEQELSFLSGKKIAVTFVPHLLPVDRGILTTIYATLTKKISGEEIATIYRNSYRNEPFVRILEYGVYPNIKNVRGTNFCEVGLKLNESTNTIIILTAIDNLVKGASGQAVHNMNIILGFDEKTALENVALIP